MIAIINKGKVCVIHYCIKNGQGGVLEASPENTPITFYPGDKSVLPVIEQAVLNSGESKEISLTVLPKDAFGDYDASLKFKVIRKAFVSNEPLTLHQSIYANTPRGKRIVTIIELTENTVTVDANHELAGETLFVDIRIVKPLNG